MVDGYIEPLRAAIQSLTDRVTALEAMTTPAALAAASDKAAKMRADNLSKMPGQILNPARMPAAPGLPIAPYDPEVQGADPDTDEAIASEVKFREDRRRRPLDAVADTDAATIRGKMSAIEAMNKEIDVLKQRTSANRRAPPGPVVAGSQADQVKDKQDQIKALESNMEITPAARAVQIGRLNREINEIQLRTPPAPVIDPLPPKPAPQPIAGGFTQASAAPKPPIPPAA